jgi:predicted transcriptional regulator YheO
MSEARQVAFQPPRRSMDGERLLVLLDHLVPMIGAALPPHAEVTLHDLSLFPDTRVASHGSELSEHLTSEDLARLVDLGDGAFLDEEIDGAGGPLRRVSAVVRDTGRAPVAALTVTTDLTAWLAVRALLDQFLGTSPAPTRSATDLPRSPVAGVPPRANETVGDLATRLIDEAITATAVPVDLMKKEHKTQVVQRLQERGIFLLRDSVETVATALEVTRFTVYNYLNEIEDGVGAKPNRTAGKTKARKKP